MSAKKNKSTTKKAVRAKVSSKKSVQLCYKKPEINSPPCRGKKERPPRTGKKQEKNYGKIL